MASNNKKTILESAIKDIVSSYTSKNDTLLNKYINPNLGVYFILKVKDDKYWKHRSNICLKKECIGTFNLPNLYSQMLIEQRLDTSKLDIRYQNYSPSLKSEDINIYVDEKELHVLTSILRTEKLQRNIKIDNTEFQNIWKAESNSKRVLVPKYGRGFAGGYFIFYLTYINNNWYLSIIDFNT